MATRVAGSFSHGRPLINPSTREGANTAPSYVYSYIDNSEPPNYAYDDVLGREHMVHLHSQLADSDLNAYARVSRVARDQMSEESERRLKRAQSIDKHRIVELLHTRGHTTCDKGNPNPHSTAYTRCGVLGEKIVEAFHGAIGSAYNAAPQGSKVEVRVSTPRESNGPDSALLLWTTRHTDVPDWEMSVELGARVAGVKQHSSLVVFSDPVGWHRHPRAHTVTRAREIKRARMASMNLLAKAGRPVLDVFIRWIVADLIDVATAGRPAVDARFHPKDPCSPTRPDADFPPMTMNGVRTMLRKHCTVRWAGGDPFTEGESPLFAAPAFPDAE